MNSTFSPPPPSTYSNQTIRITDSFDSASNSLNQLYASGPARTSVRIANKPTRSDRPQKDQKNRIKGKYAKPGESLVILTRNKRNEKAEKIKAEKIAEKAEAARSIERALQGLENKSEMLEQKGQQGTVAEVLNSNPLSWIVSSLVRGWDALNKATSFLPEAMSQTIDIEAQPATKKSAGESASNSAPDSTNSHELDLSSIPSPKCTSSTETSQIFAPVSVPLAAEDVDRVEKEKSSLVSIKVIYVTAKEMQVMKKVQSCLDRVRTKIPYVANQWKGGVLPSGGDAWLRGVWHSSIYTRTWHNLAKDKILAFQMLNELDQMLKETSRPLIEPKEKSSSLETGHDLIDPQKSLSAVINKYTEDANRVREEIESKDIFSLGEVKAIVEEVYEIGSACCEGIAAVAFVELCIEPDFADYLVQWEFWISEKGESHNFAVIYTEKGEPLIVADAWTNTFRAYRYAEISKKFVGRTIFARRDPNRIEDRDMFSKNDRKYFDSIEKLSFADVNVLLSDHVLQNKNPSQPGQKYVLFPPPGKALIEKIISLRMMKQYDRYTFLDRGTIYKDPVGGETHDPVGNLPPGEAIGSGSSFYPSENLKQNQ